MNDTPLGQTVRIRSEDNKEMLKHFSPYENRIRREWAAFRAKKQLAEKTPKQIQSDITALEMMIKKAFGGGEQMADGNGASVGTISLSLIIDAELDKQLSALQKSIQAQWNKVGETAEKALADSVEKAADKAVKPVEEVGKAVEKTVTQSVEKAVQKVEKPAEEVGKALESSISESAEKTSETLEKALVEPVKEAEKEAESLGKAINNKYEFGPGYSKEAMDFVNNYQPKSDKKKSKEKEELPEIDVGSFEIPSEPIDRLNKSLELTNEKIELAQEK